MRLHFTSHLLSPPGLSLGRKRVLRTPEGPRRAAGGRSPRRGLRRHNWRHMRDTTPKKHFKFSFCRILLPVPRAVANSILFPSCCVQNDWYSCEGYDSAGTITAGHPLRWSPFCISSSTSVLRTGYLLYRLRTSQPNVSYNK